MNIKTLLSELFNSHESTAETTITSHEFEKPPLTGYNFSVKESMAAELRAIGLSEAAIGRVLHISMNDVEETLQENDQIKQ